MKPEKLVNIGAAIVLLVAAYFTLFYNLGANPMWVWDEARLANNALEMIDNGDFIVTHFWGIPDVWASKPPFMIWCQVASIKAFGYNEFAIRFPSAMAGLFTCLLMIWFSKDVLGSYRPGYLASLVLLTIGAYVGFHVTRNGDYDAMLVLFTTSTVLWGYGYIIKQQHKYLYLTAISLTLAILTKGVAGVFFVPVIAFWWLMEVGGKTLFTNKHFYFSAGIVILVGLGYYVLRETLNPGYIKAVYINEVGGRMAEAKEGHSGEFKIYFYNLINHIFIRWTGYLALALVVFTLFRNRLAEEARLLGIYLFTCVLFMLLVISAAATKNHWYDAPAYPLLAFIVGALIHYGLTVFSGRHYDSKVALAIITVVVMFNKPLRSNYHANEKIDKYWKIENRFEPYMERLTEIKPELTTYNVVPDGYNAQVKFYAYVYNREKNGITVNQLALSEVNVKDTVIACEPKVINALQSNYHFKMLDEYEGCTLMVLSAGKDTTKADSSSLISNNR